MSRTEFDRIKNREDRVELQTLEQINTNLIKEASEQYLKPLYRRKKSKTKKKKRRKSVRKITVKKRTRPSEPNSPAKPFLKS